MNDAMPRKPMTRSFLQLAVGMGGLALFPRFSAERTKEEARGSKILHKLQSVQNEKPLPLPSILYLPTTIISNHGRRRQQNRNQEHRSLRCPDRTASRDRQGAPGHGRGRGRKARCWWCGPETRGGYRDGESRQGQGGRHRRGYQHAQGGSRRRKGGGSYGRESPGRCRHQSGRGWNDQG